MHLSVEKASGDYLYVKLDQRKEVMLVVRRDGLAPMKIVREDGEFIVAGLASNAEYVFTAYQAYPSPGHVIVAAPLSAKTLPKRTPFIICEIGKSSRKSNYVHNSRILCL